MRLSGRVVPWCVVFSCIVGAGCTRSTEPASSVPSALVGTWIGDTIRYAPRGTTALTLQIEASGRFEWTVRTAGLYVGQAPDELTGRTREVGQLTIVDQRASFRSDSLYIASTTDQVESARRITSTNDGFGNSTLFDRAEYAVRGDSLVLSYLSYPADSPVRTLLRFVRIR